MISEITYRKELVEKMINDDKILSFRLYLLTNVEDKEEDEAIKIIFENDIKDDDFKTFEYRNKLANQK